MNLIDKFQIKNFYRYRQDRDQFNKKIINFGWRSVSSIELDQPFIITTTNYGTDDLAQDIEFSIKEGVSAALMDDYRKFLKAYTKLPAEKITSQWKDKELDFEKWFKSLHPEARPGMGTMLYKLSALLQDGTPFSIFARKFEIIHPRLVDIATQNITEEENASRNTNDE